MKKIEQQELIGDHYERIFRTNSLLAVSKN